MLKKKVYLVTRRAGYNFGSSLQAYAMQSLFNSRGYECEILNIKENRLRGNLRIKFLNILGEVFLKIKIFKYIIGDRKFDYFTQQFIQREKFDCFNNQLLNVSKNRLNTENQINNYIGKGNIIVCGSDQIWNPLGFSSLMFLSFADPSENVLASYAPSFGISSLNSHIDEIKHLVSKFHYLSIREKSGVEILKGITPKDVELVLDPTLLLDIEQWKTLQEPINVSNKKYLLCYFLSTNCYPLDFIYDLADKFDLEIINLQTNYNSYYMDKAVNRADIGPRDFLYLIANAEYVCTNSFHCCIFSYKYNKRFYVFNRFQSDDKANQNTRIENLLSILGRENSLEQSLDCDFPQHDENESLYKLMLTQSYRYIDNLLDQ